MEELYDPKHFFQDCKQYIEPDFTNYVAEFVTEKKCPPNFTPKFRESLIHTDNWRQVFGPILGSLSPNLQDEKLNKWKVFS
jgi:hypothetical protein